MMKKHWYQKDRDNAEVFEGGKMRDGGMEDMQDLNLSDIYHKMGDTLVEWKQAYSGSF